ncbi:13041_t:CDS:2, partial [Racocetra persica]
ECRLIPSEREKERLQLTFDKMKFKPWETLKEQLHPDRVLIIFGRLNQTINQKTGGRSFSVYRLALMPENIIEIKDPTKGTEQYLEKELANLEKITKKPREYHIKEALIRYFEDMEDMRDIEEYIKEKKAGKVEYYTSEEVRKELKEYYDAKEAKEKPQINRQKAKEGLKEIGNRLIAEKIENKVERHLASNPTRHGKELKEEDREVWVAKVEHRSTVYEGYHPTPTTTRPTITERPQARDHQRKV